MQHQLEFELMLVEEDVSCRSWGRCGCVMSELNHQVLGQLLLKRIALLRRSLFRSWLRWSVSIIRPMDEMDVGVLFYEPTSMLKCQREVLSKLTKHAMR